MAVITLGQVAFEVGDSPCKIFRSGKLEPAMFLALILLEGDRRRGAVASVIVLAATCFIYLVL